MPVRAGRVFLPQPDMAATFSITPRMRPVWNCGCGPKGPPGPGGAGSARGSPSSSSWNWIGSLPPAWASSSRNDWWTKAMALEPGARRGPVGTPSGIMELSNLTGTIRAGNSVPCMSALLAALSPSPKVTKWFWKATSLPEASRPALKLWKPAGR